MTLFQAGKRFVVTGAAGFIGSHMVDRLVEQGVEVVGFDDLSSGSLENVAHLGDRPEFELRIVDVCDGIDVEGPVDAVLHLASPASPVDYLAHPIETLRVGSEGTRSALELSLAKSARFFLSSTSEVYGDPLVHPQPETYWGNVNPIGVRSVYDEAKRFSEALTFAYSRTYGLDVGAIGQAWVDRIIDHPAMQAWEAEALKESWREASHEEELRACGEIVADYRVG